MSAWNLSSDLDAATRADLHGQQYDRIIGAISAVLEEGKAAGVPRGDLGADELLPLVSFL